MRIGASKIISSAKIFVLAVFLCISLLFFVSCNSNNQDTNSTSVQNAISLTSSTTSPSINVSAKSAIAIETSSGEIYFQKNAHERLPMASTTKIMTALVAIESGDLDRIICISPDAVGVEGSSIYLYPNERVTLKNLLCALLLESANDAAAAIAIEIGGSIEGFADMMNEKACELGLKDTSFKNPHGLDAEGHFTTAHDLAIITLAAMQNDTFRQIVSTYKMTIPQNEIANARLLVNHNKMLKNYDGAIGVKTGYTKKSGRCLVSAANRDGVELICVTIDAPNDWQDHENMLNLGFSLYEQRLIYDAFQLKLKHGISGGIDSYVALSNTLPLYATVRQGQDVTEHIELPHLTVAPVYKNQALGYIYYTQNGKIIASSPLVAEYSVNAKTHKRGIFS